MATCTAWMKASTEAIWGTPFRPYCPSNKLRSGLAQNGGGEGAETPPGGPFGGACLSTHPSAETAATKREAVPENISPGNVVNLGVLLHQLLKHARPLCYNMATVATDFAELDYPLAKWHRRVWSKVDRRGSDDCWPWLGATGKNKRCSASAAAPKPYPKLYHHRPGMPLQSIAVHRLIYWLEDASLLPTDVVRHLCNNSMCCNPAHLAVGTHQDNMADKVRARNSCRGETHGGAKLTQAQVDEVRQLYDGKHWTQDALAARYEVSQMTISYIVRGVTWNPYPTGRKSAPL